MGQLQTKVPYRAGTGQEIEADIGVWIGLRAVNITLKCKIRKVTTCTQMYLSCLYQGRTIGKIYLPMML